MILAATAGAGTSRGADGPPPPNVVLIYADDLGYGDLGCYGGAGDPTPNLDKLAAGGARFTDFYVAQAVCSASRAALLTGCYPNRIGIQGALGPAQKIGISSDERTIADVLKARGYATACFGKWHLGHHPQFLPTRHGFDAYFGLPYSNDMWPKHPTQGVRFPALPLVEGEAIVALNPDQTQLTRQYTERAVGFIEANKERPFFLYLPHSMPHVPLHASEEFRGKTGRGPYADVIAEIDASVGTIVGALRNAGLEERTLVIFASDNGPWLPYGDHAGSSGPLREGKGAAFEGGVRVPFIAKWPGHIPAGAVVRNPSMTIDVLPTLAQLAGAPAPAEPPIDGRDISGLLLGKSSADPHEALFFYWGRELHAVRAGRWKLHLPHPYRHVVKLGAEGRPGREEPQEIGQALYDLESDIGEARDVAAEHPEVVARLLGFAEEARADLGDTLTGREGKNVRPAGRLETGSLLTPTRR